MLRELIYRGLPKPRGLSRPATGMSEASRILVLSNGENPTFTYYLEERLRNSCLPFEVRDLSESLSDAAPDGLFVVVCRYIRPAQLLWLYRNRMNIAGAALFIDDDLAATFTAKGGSLAYKAYIMAQGILPVLFLNRLPIKLWVSTHALQEALGGNASQSQVLGPFPPAHAYASAMQSGASEPPLTLAYHATGVHEAEHSFLVPIVTEVLRRNRDVHFEVFVAPHVRRLWDQADLDKDRIMLREKKSWPGYLEETANRRIDILLVPLIRNQMNAARAGTKRLDAVRMGAAAVFSRSHVYERHTVEGECLIDNRPSEWVETICDLIADSAARAAAREATRKAVDAMVQRSTITLPIGNGELE